MKAIVCDKYGAPDVLELREVDKPVVKDDEVLVRVHATSVNPADWHFLDWHAVHRALRRVRDGLRAAQTKTPDIGTGSGRAG